METRSNVRVTREQVPPLYALADVGALGEDAALDALRTLGEAGITWLQLRAKKLSDRSLHRLITEGRDVLQALARNGKPTTLWINDRVDLSLLFPGTALHLGQQDLPPKVARQLIGEGTWIGRSTHHLEQVREAEADPTVDVIALGPIYPTSSKANPDPIVGLKTLRQARALTNKPLVAIGGIDSERLGEVLEAGADSVALLGAFCRGDIQQNCHRLLSALADARREH